MNKYFEEIENNIDNVLQVLKNDESLCNMLVDMMKNKCNTVDWREERTIARYTLDEKHAIYLFNSLL